MKIDDGIWGALLLALAGVLLWHVQGFPKIPGQQVGPAALPGAVAVGLAVCGVTLFVRGVRARAAAAARPGWIEWPGWMASRPQLVAFAALVAVNVFYLLAVDRLGFVLTGTVYLFVLMVSLRVRRWRALLLAAAMTLAVHYAFYKLLKVPLPWGILQRVAW